MEISGLSIQCISKIIDADDTKVKFYLQNGTTRYKLITEKLKIFCNIYPKFKDRFSDKNKLKE